MSKILDLAQTIDQKTPPSRNRVVDFLRAAAILVVVFGHWTMLAVHPVSGIELHGLLVIAPWTQPLTWVFQIMPVFFLVGGYANGLSWRSARRRGETYGSWLRYRLRRLTAPLVPLLLAWTAGCGVALAVGADPATLKLTSQVALIPTWFLAAYLMVIVTAPPFLIAWERFGWWSIAAGIALAGAVDAVSITLDQPLIAYPNYLLVWASFHQFGYAWLDGSLDGWRRRLTLIVVGTIGLALLVGVGPYPVSMLTIPGEAISNSNPTRVTLAFLGMIHAGVVLLLEPALRRWLRRPMPWLVAVMINRRIMTWFLWHLTASALLSQLLLTLGGVGLPVPLSGVWWATRPLWWLVLLAITAGFVAVFGRFEEPARDERPAPAPWRPVLAAVSVIAGLAVLAQAGIVNSDGLQWVWPLLPIAGVYAFGMFRLPLTGGTAKDTD